MGKRDGLGERGLVHEAAEPTGAVAGAGDELVDLLLAADGTYVLPLDGPLMAS